MKKLLHFAITMLMLLAFGTTSFAAIQTGDAGEKVKYEFNDDTGELRIYGTGEMGNWHGSWAYGYSGESPISSIKTKIKSVVIEEGVTSIGAAFFYQCSRLTSVSIPQSVTKINYEAFRGCSSLVSITIPAGVTEVCDRSLTDCAKLAYISVEEGNSTYVSVGGVLYTKDLQKIVRFPEALNVIEYVIPEGVIMAATDALYKLANVQSITIPTSMTHIDYGSFDTSPKLTTLVFKSMTAPTFGKKTGEALSVLSEIYVPCGAEQSYKNNAWAGFKIKGALRPSVLVNFQTATNDPELGDVAIDRSLATCDQPTVKFIITAQPTSVGRFSHWQDGSEENPRIIEVPATSSGVILYTAYFEPKEFTVTLKKNLKAVNGKETRDINNDFFQLSIDHNGVKKETATIASEVTGKYHYGDVVTLYCDVQTTGYKFNKWSDGVKDNPRQYVVKGDAVLVAQLAVGQVTIKTKVSGGTEYGSTTPTTRTVSFGESVNIKATPTDNYVFSRWDDGDTNAERVVTATVDKTYTAYFNVKTFKVSVDVQEEEMGKVTGYGTFNAGTNVTLVATANEGYDFVGWSGDKSGTGKTLSINAINKNYNIIAKFKPKEYTITFKGESGTVLSSKSEKYNTMPTEPAVPAKASTTEFDYEFAGWAPEVVKVTGPQTYTATYKPVTRSYTVKFVDGDGKVKQESDWKYGTTPVYSGPTPTKTATAQYSYTYKGSWDKVIVPVKGDATYTAQFNQTLNKYDITFVDSDGATILKPTEQVAYGTIPTKPSNPTKEQDDQYTYTFDEWSPAVAAVTGDQVYTATYKSTLRKYDITFKDGDGNKLQTVSVEYGKVPSYTESKTPTKSSTDEFEYTFNNTWSPAIVAVSGPQTYTAQFNQAKRKYDVIFKNYNGTTLQQGPVEYGEIPVYSKAEPTKPDDAKTKWKFSGWAPSISAVRGAQTYTAQFVESDAILYTITYKNPDGNTITTKKFKYGEMPSFDGTPILAPSVDKVYTFSEWNPSFVEVTKDATYTAVYTSVARPYEITFVDENGTTVLQKSDFAYGTKPSYSGVTPSKAANAEYTYTHDGWTPAIVDVVGEATYKAVYKATKNKYTVTFVDYDDKKVFKTQDVEYGSDATAPADPTRVGHTFAGWQGSYTNVTKPVTIRATYDKNKYTIIFKNDDGTILDEKVYEYGDDAPSYAGTPTKAATAEYTYTFKSWDKTPVKVVGDATYTATYNATKNKYDVYFYADEEGKQLLQKINVEYGVIPEYTKDKPTKAKTAEFSYEFSGWTPEVVSVIGEAKYYATFNESRNLYQITYVNWDGSALPNNVAILPYGFAPTYSGTPTRPSTAEFSYEFSGWSPMPQDVTQDQTYTAVYTPKTRKYNVIFKDWDGKVLLENPVEYGLVPNDYGMKPTRPSDGMLNYTFTGWSPALEKVTKDVTYTAQYSTAAVIYSVTLLDYKGGKLNVLKVPAGDKLVVNIKPDRPATESHTYEFTGWDPAVTANTIVTADMTLKPVYKETLREYDITFVVDGKSTTSKVKYGLKPVEPSKPQKNQDAQYTYAFDKWDKEVVAVTGDATYTALFKKTLRKYRIIFADYDNKTLQSTEWEYGTTPSCSDPTRKGDAQYTYTFSGWEPNVANVTGEATYKAQYNSAKNSYLVTFKNEDGTVLLSKEYVYGDVPTYDGTPKKSADAQYTYTFSGWDKEIVAVEGPAEYNARYSKKEKSYTITFANEDGTKIKTISVAYGATPEFKGKLPEKAATAQYTYKFDEWSPKLVPVTKAATYKATFIATTNKYTIKFMNGDTELQSSDVEYGKEPSYTGATPTKEGDAQYTYTFSGWEPNVANVTGAATYYAQFKQEVNSYKVKFLNYNNEVLQESTVPYGSTPAYTGSTPIKPGDAKEAYKFKGWSPSVTSVTGDAEYVAEYTSAKKQYTITFMDVNSNIYKQEKYEYGAMPECEGPERPSDGVNNYKFMFWLPELKYVTEDATYLPIYSTAEILYTIKFLDYDGKLLLEKKFEPGQLIVGILTPLRPSDGKYTYEFAGWDPELKPNMTVEGDVTFTATYKETACKYKIRFVTDEGVEISSSDLEYGVLPEAPKNVVKEPSAEYTYTFKSWDKEIVAVSGDATYTAQFDATKRSYLIKFLDYDGKEIQSSEVEYGVKPTCPSPTRSADAQYTYTFSGWDKEIVAVSGSAEYTAQYSTTTNSYKITFVDYNGTELQQITAEYGAMPKYTGATPTRESEGGNNYTFKGWQPELTNVKGDATYKAVYSTADVIYTVTFVDYDGTELLKKICDEGEKLTVDIVPQREGDEKYTYEFAGWDPEFVANMTVTSDLTFKAVYSETLKKYTIKLLSNNDLFGTVSGGGEYEYGQVVTIEATANDGYIFVSWGDEMTSNKRVISVTGDMTFTANFELDNGYEKPQKPDEFDPNSACYFWAPSVALYDWLLMLDVNWFKEKKFNLEESNVTWYRIVDEQDDACKENMIMNDEVVGMGFYFTMDNNLRGTGDYYAIVTYGDIQFRTRVFSYSASNKVLLLPTKASRGQVLRIKGLIGEAVISVYDISGRHVKTEKTDGSLTYEITAEEAAGVYVVHINDGRETVVKYLVK